MRIFFLLVYIIFSKALASTENVFVEKVHIHSTSKSTEVKSRIKKFLNLKGEYRNLVHLRDTIKLLASDGGYKNFEFTISNSSSQSLVLDISFALKPILEEVKFQLVDKEYELDFFDLSGLKKGFFYDDLDLNNVTIELRK